MRDLGSSSRKRGVSGRPRPTLKAGSRHRRAGAPLSPRCHGLRGPLYRAARAVTSGVGRGQADWAALRLPVPRGRGARGRSRPITLTAIAARKSAKSRIAARRARRAPHRSLSRRRAGRGGSASGARRSRSRRSDGGLRTAIGSRRTTPRGGPPDARAQLAEGGPIVTRRAATPAQSPVKKTVRKSKSPGGSTSPTLSARVGRRPATARACGSECARRRLQRARATRRVDRTCERCAAGARTNDHPDPREGQRHDCSRTPTRHPTPPRRSGDHPGAYSVLEGLTPQSGLLDVAALGRGALLLLLLLLRLAARRQAHCRGRCHARHECDRGEPFDFHPAALRSSLADGQP